MAEALRNDAQRETSNSRFKRLFNETWHQYNRYIHHYGNFVFSLYIIAIFFSFSFLKYLARLDIIHRINFFTDILLVLLCAILTFVIISSFIIWRVKLWDQNDIRNRRNDNEEKFDITELVIYIPFVFYECISIFMVSQLEDNGRVFFSTYATAQAATFIGYFCWRGAQMKITNSKYIIVISSVTLTLLASLSASHCLYLLYKDSKFLTDFVNFIWKILVPQNTNGLAEFLANQPILTSGVTLLLGCLLVVSWAKDTPCKTWNPFSAFTLQLSNRILFMNLFFLMFFLYSILAASLRLTFIMFFVLLASYVTTSIYCNHMQSDSYILVKVIWYLKLYDILYFGYRGNDVLQTYVGENEAHQSIAKKYAGYVTKTQNISATIIRHMRHNNCNQQINHSLRLLKAIGKHLHTDDNPKNIGFLTGLGCIPPEVDTEVQIEDTILYVEGLFNILIHLAADTPPVQLGLIERLFLKRRSLRRISRENRIQSIYYQYITLGMYIALFSLIHSINTSPRKITSEAQLAFCQCCNNIEAFVSEYVSETDNLRTDAQNLRGDARLSLNYQSDINDVIGNNHYTLLHTLFQQVFCGHTN